MGRERLGSDTDLTLTGEGLTVSDLIAIESQIDDLNLPYKIDLSIQAHIEGKSLLDHIKRVGIEFYRRPVR